MALISTTTTGGFSDVGGTYVGGVVPVEGDNVTNVSTATLIMRGTHIWGNDSATPALTNAGTISFSTLVNTDLTLKGTLVNSGTVAIWRRGTLDSPMPAGITSKIKINYSATLANNKHNINIGGGSKFNEWSEVGATRNRQFTIPTGVAAGATSMTVSDFTGGQVGDIIFIEATNTTANQREHRVLASVSGNLVGWTTPLLYSHAAGCWGGNLSSNVLWQSYSASFGACVQILCQTTQARATINIKQVSFHGLYGQGDLGGFSIGGTNAVTVANSAVGVIDNIAACDLLPDGTNAVANNAILGVRLGYSGNWTYPVVYSRQGYNSGLNAIYTSSGGTGYFTNAFICGVNGAIFSQFSQGGVGCKIVNSRITNNQQINAGASMIGFSMDGVTMDGSNNLLFILQGDYTFNNCSFGQTYGFLNTTQLIANSNNSLSTLNFNNCLVPNVPVVTPSTYQNALANKPVILLNKNQDTTQQEIYLNTGAIVRDNAQLIRSRSSIKFSPYSAGVAHGYAFSVAATSGVTYIFRFGLRYDATYGTATPPSVTVSGLGITPQTFVAGGSANTDYAGTVTVTPVTTGVLTVTISGQTTATLGTGSYWFSGMSVNPWIDWTQWYGYTYAPTIPTQTVDPVVVLSESAAAALTGLGYATGTLTISGTRTISNVYDWLKWYEASNRLTPIITSPDGKNFATAANIALSGALTIPGGAVLAANGTFVLTGALTGAVTGNVAQATPTDLTGVIITGNLTYNTSTPITVTLTDCIITGTISNSGTGLVTITKVNTDIGTVGTNVTTQQFATISAPNLLSGSRVRLYNVTDSVEMYNGVLSGAGFSQSFQYTGDKTVQLTATYTSGATAKLGVLTTGVFTSVGLTFLDSQVDDPVYNAYMVDGSTVTGFTADYVNTEVNLTLSATFLGSDLYAWWVYNETTEPGIRSFFGGITAVDVGNLLIQVPIVNLYFDNSTAAFIFQNDNIRIYRSDGAYPARTVTSGGGGIDINWLNNVYNGTPTNLATSVWGASTTANNTTGTMGAKLNSGLTVGTFIALKDA